MVILLYIILLFVGIVITVGIFEMEGIENNTAPAIKLGGLLILGVLIAASGFFLQSNQIKKWNPAETEYKINRIKYSQYLVMRGSIWDDMYHIVQEKSVCSAPFLIM